MKFYRYLATHQATVRPLSDLVALLRDALAAVGEVEDVLGRALLQRSSCVLTSKAGEDG